MTEGDQPPIGVILWAGKYNDLVRYATQRLAHSMYLSTYLIILSYEKQQQEIITWEKGKPPLSNGRPADYLICCL